MQYIYSALLQLSSYIIFIAIYKIEKKLSKHKTYEGSYNLPQNDKK